METEIRKPLGGWQHRPRDSTIKGIDNMNNMKNGNIIKCILCNHFIRPKYDWTLGHNAEPLAEGRCCDDCNKLVIVERILEAFE